MSFKDIAVSVRGLSKSYTIVHNSVKATTIGEVLTSRMKKPVQRAEKETFWALQDIEFDIKKGSVIGIIGRNGAGKSTLLKILSQIVEPTKGEIKIYGRVGSLLEVGTGFHPELTGRENIYLNGAILGMQKPEISRQFDSIVEFAEVSQFLDTPVKRYSSGMYVRLAFAVAAHLNPEILIVDEVLAVGDAQFQNKCLNKMNDVAKSGRTVIFVSHNMNAVNELCDNALLLSKGRAVFQGDVSEAISKYSLSRSVESQDKDLTSAPRINIEFGKRVIITSVLLADNSNVVYWRDDVDMTVSLKSIDKAINQIDYGIGINDSFGVRIFTFESTSAIDVTTQGDIKIFLSLTDPKLVPGRYSLSIGIRSRGVTLDYVDDALSFEVNGVDRLGNPKGFTHGAKSGYIESEVQLLEVKYQ